MKEEPKIIHTTVADLQLMLRDMPPEQPVAFTDGPLPANRYVHSFAERLSLAHAYLFRAKEIIGTILSEVKR